MVTDSQGGCANADLFDVRQIEANSSVIVGFENDTLYPFHTHSHTNCSSGGVMNPR